MSQRRCRLLEPVDEVGRSLGSLSLRDEIFDGLEEVEPGATGPRYKRPGHSRAPYHVLVRHELPLIFCSD
jgi:hypothetical protein